MMGVFTNLPNVYSTGDLARDFAESFASDDDESNDIDLDQMETEEATKKVEEEQSFSESSSVDEAGDVEPNFLEEKLKQLQDIEDRLKRYEYKINLSKEQYEKLLVNLVVYVWTTKAGVQLKNRFDQLGASKHRTKLGVIVEGLMKLLCELDQVQSFGNSQIKSKRRSLVRSINNSVLPRADSAFSKATQFVELTLRLVKNNTVEKPTTEEPPEQTETSKQTPKVVQNEESNAVVSKEVVDEEDSKKLETEESSDRSEEKSAVDFKTSETHSAYVIRITIPKTERIRDVSFTLDSDSEMTIKGKTFSLPVEVNPRNATLSEATYEFVDRETILVSIPKRKRRVIPPRYRQPTYENFDHSRHYRRPTIWGW